MKEIDFVIWQEGKYFVAQCLNVNVNTFGETIKEAKSNLKQAVELYFEDSDSDDILEIKNVIVGKETINA
jgi:predicted RNase H-like HicB family nuclease